MSWKKWLIGLGIGGAAVGAVYLYRQGEAGSSLDLSVKPMVHTVVPLVIRVDVRMKNTAKTDLKIKYPYVKLMYKGAEVGSSQVLETDVPIPAFKETLLNPPVMISIPILGLFSIGGTLLNDLTSGVEVVLQAYTKTYVHLGGTLQKFEVTENITLKKAA